MVSRCTQCGRKYGHQNGCIYYEGCRHCGEEIKPDNPDKIVVDEGITYCSAHCHAAAITEAMFANWQKL